MRLRHAAPCSLGLAVAGVLVNLLLPAPAHAAPTGPGTAAVDCGKASAHDFPIRTRVRGGPATYRAGDGPGTWSVDLTNTTGAACRGIHPLIVLTARSRRLHGTQVSLQLADPQGRMRSLTLQTSDEDEVIGVPDKDTPGFTIPAHGTVAVHARLAFAAGTRKDEVVVSAATVQRKGDDGDWVGESNAYRFTVVTGRDGGGPATGDPDRGATTEKSTGTTSTGGRSPGREQSNQQQGTTGPDRHPERPDGSTSPPRGTGTGVGQDHGDTGVGITGTGAGESPAPEAGSASPGTPRPALPALADTGETGVLVRTALAVVLIGAGALLVVVVERHRSRRGNG